MPQQAHKRSAESIGESAPDDRLLKVAEVGKLLGYSRATVYRLIDIGELPVVRVGGTIRFRYRSILQWMVEHETPAARRPPARAEYAVPI